MYIAHFNYENQNATPVYIPVGPKNITSGAAHLATGQPVVFQPGGGTWDIPFSNVGQLTWQITSNKNNGTSGAIPANSSNVVCSNGGYQSLFEQEADSAAADTDLRIYPNPSTGKVFLLFGEGQADVTSLEVYNALGMKCPVMFDPTSEQSIELDLSSFGRGMYIINIMQAGSMDSRTVIIE